MNIKYLELQIEKHIFFPLIQKTIHYLQHSSCEDDEKKKITRK